MTRKPPIVVAPEAHVVRSGSGSIWNKWMGWRVGLSRPTAWPNPQL
jgi:hypothetical protein